MIRAFTAVATLIVVASFGHAQQTPSPAHLSCLYCRPTDPVTGSVRSVLAVEKRDEYPFDTTVDLYNSQGQKVKSVTHSSDREVHSGQIVRLDSMPALRC